MAHSFMGDKAKQVIVIQEDKGVLDTCFALSGLPFLPAKHDWHLSGAVSPFSCASLGTILTVFQALAIP